MREVAPAAKLGPGNGSRTSLVGCCGVTVRCRGHIAVEVSVGGAVGAMLITRDESPAQFSDRALTTGERLGSHPWIPTRRVSDGLPFLPQRLAATLADAPGSCGADPQAVNEER